MMGITHVLNAAEGCRYGQVDTGHSYYRDMPHIRYDHSFHFMHALHYILCLNSQPLTFYLNF